jgi:hypothetical protein
VCVCVISVGESVLEEGGHRVSQRIWSGIQAILLRYLWVTDFKRHKDLASGSSGCLFSNHLEST